MLQDLLYSALTTSLAGPILQTFNKSLSLTVLVKI